MKQFVWEVIEAVQKAKKKDDKIRILKENESWALKDILRGTMDNKVKWNLPAGPVPFTRNDGHNAPSNLIRENVKFKYFVEGGEGEKMLKPKRENIFIGLLEGVHPLDADLVVGMINKQKIKGITKALTNEAFPNLIKE